MCKRPEHQLALLGYSCGTNQADLMLLTELIDELSALEIIGAVHHHRLALHLGVVDRVFRVVGDGEVLLRVV